MQSTRYSQIAESREDSDSWNEKVANSGVENDVIGMMKGSGVV